jgi:hypothetical protein
MAQGQAPGNTEAVVGHNPVVAAGTGAGLEEFQEPAEAGEWVVGRERAMSQVPAHTVVGAADTDFHPLAAGIGQVLEAVVVVQLDLLAFPSCRIWRRESRKQRT